MEEIEDMTIPPAYQEPIEENIRLGITLTGKSVYYFADHKDHFEFSMEDHSDAAILHYSLATRFQLKPKRDRGNKNDLTPQEAKKYTNFHIKEGKKHSRLAGILPF